GISTIDLTPDGKRILACLEPNQLELWDTYKGILIRRYPDLKNTPGTITISPDGKTAIFDCALRRINGVVDWATVKIWDIAQGQIKHSFGKKGEGFSPPFVFSPNSKIAFGHFSKENNVSLVLWEVATGKTILTFEDTAKSAFKAAFSPKGDQL